jgi:hypothetical protein
VSYFYAKSDSLVHCAIYSWRAPDRERSQQLMLNGEEAPEQWRDRGTTIFKAVAEQLREELGAPKSMDEEAKRTVTDGDVSYQREARWKNGRQVIEVSMGASGIGCQVEAVQYWP